jgi:hypothetical protein
VQQPVIPEIGPAPQMPPINQMPPMQPGM